MLRKEQVQILYFTLLQIYWRVYRLIAYSIDPVSN